MIIIFIIIIIIIIIIKQYVSKSSDSEDRGQVMSFTELSRPSRSTEEQLNILIEKAPSLEFFHLYYH
jgi:hypothetical protein